MPCTSIILPKHFGPRPLHRPRHLPAPLPPPPCSFCRDGLLLLHREAQYAPGGPRHATTPLALLWKDAACSRYLLDTDAAGAALAAQAVVLEYRMDRSVATADEAPVVLGRMPEAFVAQLGCVGVGRGAGGHWGLPSPCGLRVAATPPLPSRCCPSCCVPAAVVAASAGASCGQASCCASPSAPAASPSRTGSR